MATHLLGEDALIRDIGEVITNNPSFLINIFGEEGTGKTALLDDLMQGNWLDIPVEKVNMDQIDETLFDITDEKILLLDNADQHYAREPLKSLLEKSFSQHANKKILITSRSKFFLEALPGINHFQFEIGNRFFDVEDFKQALRSPSLKEWIGEQSAPDIIIKNLFLFTTYCRNFNYVHEVLDEVRLHMERNKEISPSDLINMLTESALFKKIKQDMVIDTKNVETNDFLFYVRPKDKIEKLADLILKYYPDEHVLIEVISNQFNSSFIEDNFSRAVTYEEKVLNFCLTHDPVELLVKILGPRDIIMELHHKNIAESVFTYSMEAKAKLLLKQIGMNIVEKPKGLDYFINQFQTNKQKLKSDVYNKTNKEYMMGLGISCFQDLEHVFYEMLNFYATYLFGSLDSFMKRYNEDNPSNRIIDNRITFGQYIGLFSYLNKLAKLDQYQLKMVNLNIQTMLPKQIVQKLEHIASMRTFFSHFQKVQNVQVPYHTYQKKTIALFDASIEALQELKSFNVFPEIIKIKEIKFDEFGRKLFTAIDWDNNELRFSLSDNFKNIDIYSHYYILRHNQKFMINPILTPRMIEKSQQQFSGEHYQQSSQTQSKQGNALIRELAVEDGAKVLDIGCGNGSTTIELWEKGKDLAVDAFDLSDSMIETAIANRDQAGISKQQLHFFVMTALDLNSQQAYDLVFSNAALHWVTDYETMYKKIYDSLKPNGRIAIHQGGYDSYKGLHEKVQTAISRLDLEMYYQNWTYPIYYPTKESYEDVLTSIGFKDISIKSVESDGKEYPNLAENFANASLIPYYAPLPDEKLHKKLKREFLHLCKTEGYDGYSHRLYAFASKGSE
ncbi:MULTISPECIES: class I SAM-dependent methyltransferase [Gracilibacillus]|uniref:class I SAM-dependent methyltransferase n=1 Tax=Gracilibacillus TaxID=74385 RepID=UPI00082495A2|nr:MULTISPECIES: class I SAM-dependent methyltransferase [Gracilibacillus]